MLEETQDDEVIIERVAALDVGKAEVVCCVRVPGDRGLIRPSFVPPAPIRRLRDLTRYRIDLVGTCTAEKNRVEKLLEDAQIKPLDRRQRHLRCLRAGHDGRTGRRRA